MVVEVNRFADCETQAGDLSGYIQQILFNYWGQIFMEKDYSLKV